MSEPVFSKEALRVTLETATQNVMDHYEELKRAYTNHCLAKEVKWPFSFSIPVKCRQFESHGVDCNEFMFDLRFQPEPPRSDSVTIAPNPNQRKLFEEVK